MTQEHECAYAMCVHDNEWHAACARAGCPFDHFHLEELHPITCAYCNSPDHMPIDCKETR
jgi:hypothetical protein